MTLIEILPDLMWHATQQVKFGPIAVDTRMMIDRLPDRSLWIHSPVHPDEELVAAVRRLGDVSYVVAPNLSHHLHFRDFLDCFPSATGFIALGLEGKRADLASYPTIGSRAPWSDTLEGTFIAGLPTLNETAWYHRASGTMILADLLFCIDGRKGFFAKNLARILGVHDRLAMSRTMRLLVTDRNAFAQSVATLCSYRIERVILAHDQIVEKDAGSRFKAAFAWLRR